MEQHLLLIILIGGKYNLPIIEQFIHSTFSFVSSDPQKYKGYDREGSDNRHKRDKCYHKAAQYKEYQE